MAVKYSTYKKRRFNLQKDAMEWAKTEKARVEGVMTIKIDINYHPNEGLPYEAVLLVKE